MTTSVIKGSFTRNGTPRTTIVGTPLDGDVTATLRAPRSLRAKVQLLTKSKVVATATVSGGGQGRPHHGVRQPLLRAQGDAPRRLRLVHRHRRQALVGPAAQAAYDETVRQVAQRARDGSLVVVETPAPALQPGWVLVRNRASLISAGYGALEGRARRQEPAPEGPGAARPGAAGRRARTHAGHPPDDRGRPRPARPADGDRLLVGGRRARGRRRRRGHRARRPRRLRRRRLGQPRRDRRRPEEPRGAAARGCVVRAGRATATVGAIALHGVAPERGRSSASRVGVIGLGLVGQLATSLALAAGCSVVGVDLDARAVELAREAGADAFLTGAPELEAACARADARPRPRRRADLRGVALDRSGRAGGARWRATAAAWWSSATCRSRSTAHSHTRRSWSCGSPARTARAATTSSTRSAAATCRPATSAGRSSATSRRSSTCSRAGALDIARLTTHRFPVERAAEAYELLTEPNGQRPFGIVLEYEEERAGRAPDRRARAAAQRLGRRRVRRRRKLRARDAPARVHRGRGDASSR